MPHATHSLGWRAPAWARGAAAAVVLGVFTSIGTGGAEGTPRIKIATAIVAQPASQVAMLIQLERSEALPRNSFIRLRGLPPSVSLTEGFAIGPGVWAVPLAGLATLNVNVPAGVSGQSNLLVTLVDVEGTILAEAATALVVGPTVVRAPADQQAAAPSAEHKTFSYRPAGNGPPAPQPAELSEARVEKLLARGESHLAQGNVAAARARRGRRFGGRSNLACYNL
jgi:hypothetical protein